MHVFQVNDDLSIDDLYKALGYVYLYKYVAGGQEGTDTINIRRMTLTLISMNKPTKILQHVQDLEKRVYSHQEGIYYIEGMDIPIQLVIQSELPKEENEYLTLLTDQLEEKEQLQHVLMDYFKDHKDQLYRLLLHAVFEANPNLFVEVVEMGKLQLDPEVQKKLMTMFESVDWIRNGKKKDLRKESKKGN